MNRVKSQTELNEIEMWPESNECEIERRWWAAITNLYRNIVYRYAGVWLSVKQITYQQQHCNTESYYYSALIRGFVFFTIYGTCFSWISFFAATAAAVWFAANILQISHQSKTRVCQIWHKIPYLAVLYVFLLRRWCGQKMHSSGPANRRIIISKGNAAVPLWLEWQLGGEYIAILFEFVLFISEMIFAHRTGILKSCMGGMSEWEDGRIGIIEILPMHENSCGFFQSQSKDQLRVNICICGGVWIIHLTEKGGEWEEQQAE